METTNYKARCNAFSPPSLRFLSLRSRYATHHFVLKQPQSALPLRITTKSRRKYRNKRIYSCVYFNIQVSRWTDEPLWTEMLQGLTILNLFEPRECDFGLIKRRLHIHVLHVK